MSLDVLDKEIKADYQKFRSHHKSTEKLRVSVQYLDRLMKPQWIAAILGSGCGVGFSAKKRQATPEEAVIMRAKLAFAANELGYDPSSYFANKTSYSDNNIRRHQSVVWSVIAATAIEKKSSSISAGSLKSHYQVYASGRTISEILESYKKSRKYSGYLDGVAEIFNKALNDGTAHPFTVNGYYARGGGILLIKSYKNHPDGHRDGLYIFAGLDNHFNLYMLPGGGAESARGDKNIYDAAARETYEETSRYYTVLLKDGINDAPTPGRPLEESRANITTSAQYMKTLPAFYSSLTGNLFVVHQNNALLCSEMSRICMNAQGAETERAFQEMSGYVVISLDYIIKKGEELRRAPTRSFDKDTPIFLQERTGSTIPFDPYYFYTFVDDLENLKAIRASLTEG